MQFGTDHTKSADDACRTRADFALTGHIVKVQPFAVFACNNPLGTQNHTVFVFIAQLVKCILQFGGGKGFGGFPAPACKHFVGMVMMMVVIVTTAGAMFIMLMMVLVVMLMVMASAITVFIVLMMVLVMMLVLMVMASAIAVLIVLMMVLMMMLVLVVMASAIAIFIMFIMIMVVMVMMFFMQQMLHRCLQRISAFNGFEQCFAVQLRNGGGYDNSRFVV